MGETRPSGPGLDESDITGEGEVESMMKGVRVRYTSGVGERLAG